VPKAGIVYILGDVRLPGGYTMTNNEARLTALQLVARAGGTNNTAVPSHAKLIRRSEGSYVELPLPLSAMQKGRHEDLELRAGDIVYVPFSYLRNFAVTGAASITSSVGSAAVYRF
jgi:polysaccharide biosynthesis/export protein